jgi:predicted site-specific integrase-resolvase
MTKQATVSVNIDRVSTDDLKQNLENRVASAARLNTDSTSKVVAEKATVLPGLNQEDETPNLPLPNNNQNFNP